MKRYEEVPPAWRAAINAEVEAGGVLEDLVFVKQKNGGLTRYDGSLDVERKPGHCIIVLSVGKRRDGQPYMNMTYAMPFADKEQNRG